MKDCEGCKYAFYDQRTNFLGCRRDFDGVPCIEELKGDGEEWNVK
jgi:hypothetical protein